MELRLNAWREKYAQYAYWNHIDLSNLPPDGEGLYEDWDREDKGNIVLDWDGQEGMWEVIYFSAEGYGDKPVLFEKYNEAKENFLKTALR